MKKINFLIGMVGISLALGMMVIACDTDGGGGGSGTSLAGTTWEGDGLTVVFTATMVTVTGSYNFTTSYTLTGTEITMTVPPPASVSGGIAKGIISGNQMTVTYGQNETYKLTKKTGAVIPEPGNDDFTKVADVQAYRDDNESVPYTGSGTLKIGNPDGGGLTVGKVENGIVSFELPTTVQSQYLDSFSDIPSGMTVSNANAKALLNNLRLYAGNNYIGYVSLMKNGSTFHQIEYMYFDRACSITGTFTNNDYNGGYSATWLVNAQVGWNKVYIYGTQSNETYTTNLNNLPSDLKWIFVGDQANY